MAAGMQSDIQPSAIRFGAGRSSYVSQHRQVAAPAESRFWVPTCQGIIDVMGYVLRDCLAVTLPLLRRTVV